MHFAAAMAVFLLASGLSSYVVLSDILEQQQAQDARLEHLTREVLHEINLPISTIETNLKMLATQHTDPKAHKRAMRISAAVVRLKRLYAELAYSIKKEIHPVEKESFDLKDILEERVAIQRELGRNPLLLQVQSCRVSLDKIGLEQVIDNLLENAMKYSPIEEPVFLTLKAKKLEVKDQGKGMDANQILHIYERYYQGNSQQQGEGIGLTLVKRYCDEAEIGIRITSEPEEGTSVILDFSNTVLSEADR